ncbi:MAG: ABC transporter substrate-binding protein [Parvibaculaceae bacterium]
MKKETPAEDLAVIAADSYLAGNLNRRTFLAACAFAGLAPHLLLSERAKAAAGEIVFAGYGGDAATNMAKAYGEPYTAAGGSKVVYDGTGPTEGAIKAMVDTGKITWDIADAENFTVVRLGKSGTFRPMDYTIVDKAKVPDGYALEHGIAGYFFSYVLAYDQEKVGKDAQLSWADFWDVKKYPGKRTLWKWMNGALEAALLADGVAPKDLFPMDIERAMNKILALKEHLIFWESGASSQQMFLNNEVVMGSIWNTRASILERDSGGRVTWTWNQGVLAPGCYSVLKDNPAGDEAFKFIAFMQDPKLQAEYLRLQGGGPPNPAASALLTPELKRVDPMQPEHLSVQVRQDQNWWADNYDQALNRYLETIGG